MTATQTATKKTHKVEATKRSPGEDRAREIRRRMLTWPNPVEDVNNMYGSHPDGDGNEYFAKVFKK